jgi:hypothetical protein
MYWELWALNTGNLIGTFEHEDEAISIVRELLSQGWDPSDLSISKEDGTDWADNPSEPIEGRALAAWAENASDPERARRSA